MPILTLTISSAFSGGGSTTFSICAIKIRNGFTFERDLRGYIFLYFFRLTQASYPVSIYSC
ncbi:hypothetical protein PR001_g29973 [Phytophthora rubi]|uniref:Uncharacterized protein n=1 Tax=Phytophthora rubi TaxID=129364 RepID=A0A6A3GWJ4_9STRA|nr:hypothetical protein PR002_g29928 [Phytophthora rubi]KAE8961655.1 hypothetical protein PR001_g29973 [Phytophthora rubi]